MKDNQKKYLDRVVGLIVRYTVIDYDNETLSFPFLPHFIYFSFSPYLLSSRFSTFFSSSFSKYSKHTYGIVGDELEYVWDEYKDIIIDKIRNEK